VKQISQVLNQEISDVTEKSRLQEIENLFLQLKDDSKIIKQENKQIERLRKTNDKSFTRLKQVVENLRVY
jgi:hypothetical protein